MSLTVSDVRKGTADAVASVLELTGELRGPLLAVVRHSGLGDVAKRDGVKIMMDAWMTQVRGVVAKTAASWIEASGEKMPEHIRKAIAEAELDHHTITIDTTVTPLQPGPIDLVALAMRVNNLDVPDDQLAALGTGDVFYDELNRRAQESRRREETPAQAFYRYCNTSDGAALLAANRKLARPSVEKAMARSRVEPIEKTDAYTRLIGLAEDLRKREPLLSVHQAFDRVSKQPENRQLLKASLGANSLTRLSKAGGEADDPPEAAPDNGVLMTPHLAVLNGMAEDHRKANPEKSFAQSFSAVMDTPEGKAAYRKYKAELLAH